MPRRQPVARIAVPADPGKLPTKQRIEQAALQLFAAKGFEATGIRDIADLAGLSTSALYHYMGSKDELLVAFMVESMTELTRVAHAALEGAGASGHPAGRPGSRACGLPYPGRPAVAGRRR